MTKHDERLLRSAIATGVILALICAFYCVENWRGRHGWLKLKQQLEAHGGHVDWTNYIPAPVPTDKNFFGEVKMQRWFTGRGGNDLSSRLDGARNGFVEQYDGDVAAEVTVVKPGEKLAPGDADIVLSYDSALSAIALATPEPSVLPSNEIIPLIVMRDVPLNDAIKHLARNAGVTYTLDPKVNQRRSASPSTEDGRWENIRAREVLGVVLKKNNLQYIPDTKAGGGRIIIKGSGKPDVGVEAPAQERLEKLLAKTINEATNGLGGKCTHTSLGVTLTATRPAAVRPVRVIVRADELPSTNDIAAFFPALPNAYYSSITTRVEAVAIGSNTFQVRLNPPPAIVAADYLKWSDGFAEEFALIREALKRPYAQMEGDYSQPAQIPIPNFVCQRIVAQTLTDRAKCHLLLGQPEEALQDLTLVRELCRVMEGRPGRRPMTLVATMIDSAITGLYADTIAEGLRLRAWREPELAALQAQLKQINLPPLLAESFECERASGCRILETVKADDIEKWTTLNPSTDFWKKLKNPTYLMFKVGPRGWVYQNMSKVARLNATFLNGFDTTNWLVSPHRMESALQSATTDLNHFSPYNYLAEVMVPNFTRAVQTLSRNQCMADEAATACALERYRIARGEYPKALAALVPQYLEKIPTDIIDGKPLRYRAKEGKFVLYSVGWNEKDDGGIPGLQKDGSADVKQNDWVWAGSLN